MRTMRSRPDRSAGDAELAAYELAVQNLALAEATLGASADETLSALDALACSAAHIGRYDEAMLKAETLLERARRRHHWSHPVALAALTSLLGYQLDAGRLVLLVDVESLMARWSAADPQWTDPSHHRAALVQVRALRSHADLLAQTTASRAVDCLGAATAVGLGILGDLGS
jgi:hypothetical protein